jgi:hypothetical protein
MWKMQAECHSRLKESYDGCRRELSTHDYGVSVIINVPKDCIDGQASLPYQLFMEAWTVTLDAWHKDWDDAEALIQRAFRLIGGWPVIIEEISALLNNADTIMATMNKKLEEWNKIIDQQVKDTLHLSHLETQRDPPLYRQCEKTDQDAILAWAMTLTETQKQIDLGKSVETIVNEY